MTTDISSFPTGFEPQLCPIPPDSMGGRSRLALQGGAKNGATLSHCKYSENYMTELLRVYR